MSASQVQVASGSTGTTASPTSVTAALSVASTVGNTLLLVMASDNFVSTPAGWTQDAFIADNNALYGFRKTSAGETSFNITVAGAAAWYLFEYAGLIGSPLDQVASASNSAPVTAQASGTTGTLAQASELALAGFASSSSGTLASFSAYTNSYAEQGTERATTKASGTNVDLAVATVDLAATTATSTTATLSSGNPATAFVVTYKVASALSGTVTSSAPSTDTATSVTLTAHPAGGSGSYSYAWTAPTKPAGSNVTFGTASAVSTTAAMDTPGTYVFRCAINDGTNTVNPVVTVYVFDPTPGATPLEVTVTTSTGWTAVGAANVQAAIRTQPFDPAIYAQSQDNPSAQTLTVTLPAISPPPAGDLLFRAVWSSSNTTSSTVSAQLKDGATVVSTAASTTDVAPVPGNRKIRFPAADLVGVTPTKWNAATLTVVITVTAS